MLFDVFEELNAWIARENAERSRDGALRLKSCCIRVIGQNALIESGIALSLAATNDVDVYADYDYAIQKEFECLLLKHGKILDPVGHEAWMPSETRYRSMYQGDYVHALLAEAVYVLISKAKFAPEKNKNLIVEYLAGDPCDEFFELATKYAVNLEKFV